MKRRYVCLLLLLAFWSGSLPLAARERKEAEEKEERPEIKNLFSFDLGLALRGLKHGGAGLGVQYERQIIPHLAAKGYFGHSTFDTSYNELFCTTVTVGMYGMWYPFSTQLRGPYVGAGSGFDYIAYLGDKDKVNSYFADEPNGINLFAAGDLGCKISLPWNFLLDLSVGYKHVFSAEAELVGNVGEVLVDGMRFSAKLKHIVR